jgi:hypothetical protein
MNVETAANFTLRARCCRAHIARPRYSGTGNGQCSSPMVLQAALTGGKPPNLVGRQGLIHFRICLRSC